MQLGQGASLPGEGAVPADHRVQPKHRLPPIGAAPEEHGLADRCLQRRTAVVGEVEGIAAIADRGGNPRGGGDGASSLDPSAIEGCPPVVGGGDLGLRGQGSVRILPRRGGHSGGRHEGGGLVHAIVSAPRTSTTPALAEHPRIIVVDNGSGDGSAEAVRSDSPDVDVIALDRNLETPESRRASRGSID